MAGLIKEVTTPIQPIMAFTALSMEEVIQALSSSGKSMQISSDYLHQLLN